MKMDNDILIRVIVKKRACQIAYMAVRNQSTDFPVLTCCVSKLEGKYRAVIGARPKRAKLVSDENGIMANGITKLPLHLLHMSQNRCQLTAICAVAVLTVHI